MKARLSNMNAGAERAHVFFHGGPAVKRLGEEAVLYRRPLEPRIRGRCARALDGGYTRQSN